MTLSIEEEKKGVLCVAAPSWTQIFELCCLQEQNELLSGEHELCPDARQTHQGTGFLSTLPA